MEEFERRESRRQQIAEKVARLKQLPRPPSLIRGGDSVFLSHSKVYPTYVRQVRAARQEQEITTRNSRFVSKQQNGSYDIQNANTQLTSSAAFGTVDSHHNRDLSSPFSRTNSPSDQTNLSSAASPAANSASSTARLQLKEKQRLWLIYVSVARFLHIPLQAAKILAMIKLRKLFGPVIRRARMRIKKKRRMVWLLIASQWKMTRPTVEVLKARSRFFSFWPDAVLQELIDTHMVPASDTFGNVLVMGGSASLYHNHQYDNFNHHNNHRQNNFSVEKSAPRRRSPTANATITRRGDSRSPSPVSVRKNVKVVETSTSQSNISFFPVSPTRAPSSPQSPSSPSSTTKTNNNAPSFSMHSSSASSPLAIDVYISDNIGDLAIYSAKQLHPWSSVEVTQTRIIKGTKRENGEPVINANSNDSTSATTPSSAGQVLLGDLSVAAQVSAMTSKNNNNTITSSDAATNDGFRFSLELRVVGTGTTFYWRIPHAPVFDAFQRRLTQQQRDDAVRAVRCDYLDLTAPLDHSRLQQALSQWEDIQWPSHFIAKLQACLQPEFFAKGTTLFRDGDNLRQQKFILIVSGAVNLYTRGTNQQSQQKQQQQRNSLSLWPSAPSPSPHHNNRLISNPENNINLKNKSNPNENFNSFQQQIQQQLLMAASSSPTTRGNTTEFQNSINPILPTSPLSPQSNINTNTNTNSTNNLLLIDRVGPWSVLDLEIGLVSGSQKREHTAVSATDVEAWTCDFGALRRLLIVEFASFALAARASFQRFVASSMLFLSAAPAQQQQMRQDMITSSSATGGNFYFRGAAMASTVSLARAMHATPLFRVLSLELLIDLCCGTLPHPILNIASSTSSSSPSQGGNNNNNSTSSSSLSSSPSPFTASLPKPIPRCTLPGDSLAQSISSSSGSNDAPSFAVIVKGTVIVKLTKESDKPVIIPTTTSTSGFGGAKSNNNPTRPTSSTKNSNNTAPVSSSAYVLSRKDAVAVIKDEIAFENDPTKFLPSFVESPALLGCAFALVSSNNNNNNNNINNNNENRKYASTGRASCFATTLTSANRGKTSVCASDEGMVLWWEVPAELIRKGLFAVAMMSIVNNYTNSPTGNIANNNNTNANNNALAKKPTNRAASAAGGVSASGTTATSPRAAKNILPNTSASPRTNSNVAATATTTTSSSGISISNLSDIASIYYTQYRNNNHNSNNNNMMNKMAASSLVLTNPQVLTSTTTTTTNGVANNIGISVPTLSHAKQQQIQRNLMQNLQLITQQSNEIADNILWVQLVKMCQEQSNSGGGKFGGLLI